MGNMEENDMLGLDYSSYNSWQVILGPKIKVMSMGMETKI